VAGSLNQFDLSFFHALRQIITRPGDVPDWEVRGYQRAVRSAMPGNLKRQERGRQTGDSKTAREGVWISWCEWKARALNLLFLEHGLTGEPGRITSETVRDGTKRAARRREELSGC
jgi:hypothetical protein